MYLLALGEGWEGRRGQGGKEAAAQVSEQDYPPLTASGLECRFMDPFLRLPAPSAAHPTSMYKHFPLPLQRPTLLLPKSRQTMVL